MSKEKSQFHHPTIINCHGGKSENPVNGCLTDQEDRKVRSFPKSDDISKQKTLTVIQKCPVASQITRITYLPLKKETFFSSETETIICAICHSSTCRHCVK